MVAGFITLSMQSVHITTDGVGWNFGQGETYNFL
jgi:hypothetical protein